MILIFYSIVFLNERVTNHPATFAINHLRRIVLNGFFKECKG